MKTGISNNFGVGFFYVRESEEWGMQGRTVFLVLTLCWSFCKEIQFPQPNLLIFGNLC